MAQAIRQSSLVGELEASVEIKASAKKFYNMFVGTPQDLPKANPENLKGCDLQEGEVGKVGSVIDWNYVIDGQPKVMKDKFEALEPDKNLVKIRAIGGDVLKEFKSFFVTIQATPKQTGPGSVVRCQYKYEKNDEKVANPEDLIALFVKTAKDMDDMLMSQV